MRRPHRSVLTGALVTPALGALALTGCGGSSGSSGSSGPAAARPPAASAAAAAPSPGVGAPSATPGAGRSVSAAQRSAAEKTFLAAVHSRRLTATAPTLGDTQVLTLGRLTCALTSAGGTLTAAQEERIDTQVAGLVQRATKSTPAAAGEFLTVTKKDLCPTFSGQVVGPAG